MRKISIRSLCLLLCSILLLTACISTACAETIAEETSSSLYEISDIILSKESSEINLTDYSLPDAAANHLESLFDANAMQKGAEANVVRFAAIMRKDNNKALFGCPVFFLEVNDKLNVYIISEPIPESDDEVVVLFEGQTVNPEKKTSLEDSNGNAILDIFCIGGLDKGNYRGYYPVELTDGKYKLISLSAIENGSLVFDKMDCSLSEKKFNFEGNCDEIFRIGAIENEKGELGAIVYKYDNEKNNSFLSAEVIFKALGVSPYKGSSTSPTTPTETEETVEPTPPIGEPKDDMQKYYIIGGAAAAVIVLWLLMKKKKQEQSAPASTPAPSPAPAPVPPMPPMPPVNGSGETTQYPVTEPNKSNLMLAARGGALDGGIYPIQPVMKFGRLPDNNIRFPADTSGVSRHHAELRTQGTRMMLMDCGSTSGTYVKRIGKLTPQQPAEVFADDIIYIGSEKNSFIIKKM